MDMVNLGNARGTLDPLKRQALEWIDRLMSGEATNLNAEAVKRWRMLGRVHAQAFADAVRLRRVLGVAVEVFAEVEVFAKKARTS